MSSLRRWFGDDYRDPSKRYRTSGGFQRTYAYPPMASSYRRRSSSAPARSRGVYRRPEPYSRIRRALNIEKKFFDTDISFLVDNTGEVPATGQLTLIPQGTLQTERVGRQCQVKSIQTRLQLSYLPAADTSGAVTAYIYLVQDKQANGAAAAATDVLTATTFGTAMINMANSERFRIVRRWVIEMQAGAGVSGAFGQDIKTIDEYVKVNTSIEYDATAVTGAITTIRSNNYFLMAGTSGSGDTDDKINVVGTVRLRFTDL